MEKAKKITLAIKNCNIVLEKRTIYNGVLLISNDKIADFGKAGQIEIPQDTPTFDANGAFVGPGFVDIHVHAGAGHDICFEVEQCAEFFLKHGTTSILATPSYSQNFDTMMSAIKNIKAKMGKVPTLKLLYMECPYINPTYGANSINNPWRHGIAKKEYTALVDEAGDFAKVWTIAPELNNIREFLTYARKVNLNVAFAIGHSEANYQHCKSIEDFNPTIQTHCTNATGKIANNVAGVVDYGPDEYCLSHDNISCELISDCDGAHVRPEMQYFIVKVKGVNKVILITDNGDLSGEETYKDGKVLDINYNEYGEIAGSKLTMDRALKNVITHTGVSINDAFVMASKNPAKAIGLDKQIGTIKKGKIADLVILDNDFNVEKVILNGNIVK